MSFEEEGCCKSRGSLLKRRGCCKSRRDANKSRGASSSLVSSHSPDGRGCGSEFA